MKYLDTREQDIFRNKVLEALDEAAEEVFQVTGVLGATDAELPELFKAIDAHVERICTRELAAEYAHKKQVVQIFGHATN